MDSFYEQIYKVVRQIPYGKVMSYGQIAWSLGRLRSARAVGQAMANCPNDLPWHRVVMSDGSIAKSMHAEMRRAMLEAEGVPFVSENRVDIARCRWSGP